jgi:hypothetical protein
MAYHLEGRLLEVCDCRVLCPCWIGEDPDNGTCDSVLAYHFDKGAIDGVDVTGRTIALVSHIPGNVLNGNFRVAVYIDEGASDAQQDAIPTSIPASSAARSRILPSWSARSSRSSARRSSSTSMRVAAR